MNFFFIRCIMFSEVKDRKDFIPKKNIFMHMKQSRKIIHKKTKLTPANRIFSLCFPLILLCLFGVIAELSAQKELSAGAAAYYGGMMEYPIAALALLTAGMYLAERVSKKGK